MDPALKTDARLLPGCVSRLWLYPEFRDGRCWFKMDAEALISKGIAAVVCGFYDGETPADIIATEPEFLAEAPEYFGGQQVNQVLVDASKNVATGWQYLPYQVYANSVFPDTVGTAYTASSDLNAGLQAWQEQIVSYGDSQGFSVNK